MTSLYRPEVLDRRRRIEGEVVVGAPVSWMALGYATALVVVAAVVFAFSASYSNRQMVTGWVVPEGGLIRVAARYGGVLDQIDVTEGQGVDAGQVLGRIRLSKSLNQRDSGEIIENATYAQLTAVEAAGRVQAAQVLVDVKNLKARLTVLKKQKAEAQHNLGVLEDARNLARQNFARYEELERQGYLSPVGLNNNKAALLNAEQSVSGARMALLSTERDIDALLAELATKPDQLSQVEATARGNVAALQVNLAQTQADRGYELVAPIRGRVATIVGEQGQNLTMDSTVFMMVPPGARLEAELLVPSAAVGFVKPGQDVSLRYRAFPYEKFGVGQGHIMSISRSTLTPSEVMLKGVTLNEPVYRVRVALKNDFVRAYGKNEALQAGMLLDADIIIGKRSLIEWLLEPLYAAGRRS